MVDSPFEDLTRCRIGELFIDGGKKGGVEGRRRRRSGGRGDGCRHFRRGRGGNEDADQGLLGLGGREDLRSEGK